MQEIAFLEFLSSSSFFSIFLSFFFFFFFFFFFLLLFYLPYLGSNSFVLLFAVSFAVFVYPPRPRVLTLPVEYSGPT